MLVPGSPGSSAVQSPPQKTHSSKLTSLSGHGGLASCRREAWFMPRHHNKKHVECWGYPPPQ